MFVGDKVFRVATKNSGGRAVAEVVSGEVFDILHDASNTIAFYFRVLWGDGERYETIPSRLIDPKDEDRRHPQAAWKSERKAIDAHIIMEKVSYSQLALSMRNTEARINALEGLLAVVSSGVVDEN